MNALKIAVTFLFFISALSSNLYSNNLKSWEFGKEAPQSFCSEQAIIAERQGASEDEDFEVKSTQPKPDFSSCLGIIAKEETMHFSEPTKSMSFEEGKKYVAVIHTSKGDITCVLNSKEAPLSVTNFVQLAKGGFYNGLIFHRVVPNFVIQGGDPEGTGRGGPGYTVPAEIQLPHSQGALAWARTSGHENPKKRSSGSQFYITLEKIPYLDGEYSVFGLTTAGMDVVQKIEQGDVIKSIDIIVE